MVLETLIANGTSTIIAGIAAGLVRSLGGWLKSAAEDGTITKPEWKQLGSTVVKYIAYVTILALGLPLEEAIVVAFGLDALKNSLEKK